MASEMFSTVEGRATWARLCSVYPELSINAKYNKALEHLVLHFPRNCGYLIRRVTGETQVTVANFKRVILQVSRNYDFCQSVLPNSDVTIDLCDYPLSVHYFDTEPHTMEGVVYALDFVMNLVFRHVYTMMAQNSINVTAPPAKRLR